MNIQAVIHGKSIAAVAEITNDQVVINTAQDALDLMFDPALSGARNMILWRNQIAPAFFDLKTGLAGEVIQKFVNYGVRLAIVGDFAEETGPLADFIRESNRGRHVYFVPDIAIAMQKLA